MFWVKKKLEVDNTNKLIKTDFGTTIIYLFDVK